jgi:hypothetical protein
MIGEIIGFYHHEDDNMGSSPIGMYDANLGRGLLVQGVIPLDFQCPPKKTKIHLGWRREGYRVAVRECGMNLSSPIGAKKTHPSL